MPPMRPFCFQPISSVNSDVSFSIFSDRYMWLNNPIVYSELSSLNRSIFPGFTIPTFTFPTFNFASPFLCMPRIPFFPLIPPMPTFNFKFGNLLTNNRMPSRTSLCSKNYTISTETDLAEVKAVGYNPEKGRRLTQQGLNSAHAKSTGYCASYVKKAMQKAGLGGDESGHAYQCVRILHNNPNFKEININKEDLKRLPAGCIVVYERGAAGYSKEYGHIEIALGDGQHNVSDFVNGNIRTPNSGVHVFVPV